MSEEEKKVVCPYCGNIVDNNAETCPNCGELFADPALSNFKFISVPMFLVFETLLCSFGMYFFYELCWVCANFKNISELASEKDLKKFKKLLLAFLIFVLASLIYKNSLVLALITEMFLSYRILRIIEKHTLCKYNSPITHHEAGMLLFRTLYVVYFLDTYAIRVRNPYMRYCLETEKCFKYSIIIFLLLLALYAIGLVSLPFVHM